jgi:Xaa-Pro aminopeptidase
MLNLPAINYQERLAQVMACLDGNALLLMAQPQAYRNSTVEAPWRQDALFYYLTGFNEPDAALVVLSNRPVNEPRVILFLRDKDPTAELWNGLRMGVAAAKSSLAVDEALPISEIWAKLPTLLGSSKGLYYGVGQVSENDKRVIETLRKHRLGAARNAAGMIPVMDPAHIGGALRIIKRPEEIARMRAAASITKNAFTRVLSELGPKQSERDIHATLLNEFLRGGADMEAYGSIVAGGNNACVLHYRDNNAPLRAGQLVLIDAGCQVDNYASDVTRTFPVSGRFSPSQRALYEICLQSQKDAIAQAKPGNNWMDVQDAAFKTLAQGLIDIGLIKMPLAEALEKNAHKHFCPHSISHWIGLDVHDSGRYRDEKGPVPFEPGMYFSVEPGIYINSSDESVPEEFRGIGIRIEDDVLITESGCDVLTAGIPKEVSEVER